MADQYNDKKSADGKSGAGKQQVRKERFLAQKHGKDAEQTRYVDHQNKRQHGRTRDDRVNDRNSSGEDNFYTKRSDVEPVKSGARLARGAERVDLPMGRLLFHVLAVLEEATNSDSPIDRALAAHFSNIKGRLTPRDHTRIRDMVWGVVRRYRRLLWWLEINGQTPQVRKLLLADLVLTHGKNVQDITHFCKGGGGYLKRLTDSEARVLSAMDGKQLADETMPEAVTLECPSWAEKGLREVFGDRFPEEVDALREAAPLDIRVNPFKGNRDDLIPRLEKAGCKVEKLDWLPYGLRITDAGRKAHLPFYERGEFEIQDAGSQVLAAMVAVEPGQRVIDFCAGAGGKTLALAADMDNRGQLIAADVHNKRLNRAAQRLKRAGVFNAERKVLESERDPWVKKNKGKFDRVLVDAPCSGTGSWRRAPDSKWRRDEKDLEELVALQGNILTSAARLVKPGGRLVYATCSLLPVENEDQVAKLLRSRPDFKLVPVKDVWEERMPSSMPETIGDMLRLSPATNDTDGFFAAVLERDAE
ncbi:RsmB/NOP family class I SAM-dependent RNA methyltransferase [uncultured Kiloniella sp.]|uniref:RsmB/NOP family class I SAM-dependent RNA methyltransferase n=1 Tax=uncultured Kiloniella sp. TaxID=1133091 RepID=UPI00261A2D7D|nr:RsmB/NOP family class I SAM-dependent RNA methyltransferase [uncultured Kiloniella sp.]